ncbi:MAG TPA: AAA family ATPase [Candidatus Elarobacter sp.]|nr:AAA family ATPase [Candidatus Elarobacter sp.]
MAAERDMTSAFLERDEALAELNAGLRSAEAGSGRTILVAGEAGIGKTTLLEHFVRGVRNGRVLSGGCEALTTPRPLGAVHDFAGATAGLREALGSGLDRAALFAAVLDELVRPPRPAVLVIEDVHWADDATLDLVKFLGRRIGRVPALLVLSCRDDEASFAKLRPIVGDLPARDVTRIALGPLSSAAVERLAATARRDAAGLHAVTGGNPFFVTELLRDGAPAGRVPVTVRDAVVSRAERLSPAAHRVLQLAAVVPRAVDVELIAAILNPPAGVIEECILSGLLLAEGRTLRFRHELARVAVEAAIVAPRAAELHASVLAALSARAPGTVSTAALVHHAQRAGDGGAVVRWAPQAAREAARRGARREAAAHCLAALTHASCLGEAEHAELLDAYATHCFELNDLQTAASARESAIELFERAGEFGRQCEALAAHAMTLVRALRNADADEVSRRAIALAQRLPPGGALARAYATESYLRMLNRDYRDAAAAGELAIELAERFDLREILAGAHISVGAALMFVERTRGHEHLRTGLKVAGTLDDGGTKEAEAHVMLGTASGEIFDFAEADRHLAAGIAFARSRDLDRAAGYMECWQSLCDLYQGRWDSAGARANAAAAAEKGNTTNRVTALIALGRLRTRRGDPGASAVLDEALVLASQSGTLQRIGPVCCARAEAAWLSGRDDEAAGEAERAFALAASKGHPWILGELAFWQWRAGRIETAPHGCAEPFRLQIEGRWREAAAVWEQIGCPYEQARALADGDEPAQRACLAILDRLGARPLADRVRKQMRALGARSIPRGPQQAARANAARLTPRELDVLACLADGLRNAEIASRLTCSSRTVDHHVESIFAKLEVGNRGDAVQAARRLRVLPDMGDVSA